MSLTLVRAAAGCGKTTELARRYLGFVSQGIEVERAIAITFTRRAAAELVERVTLALRASLTGPIAEEAQRSLGSAWPLYERLVPEDPEVARRALASLPSAPIGTTDRFVHALLTEHALHAAAPVPGAEPAPIDVPIQPTASLRRHLDRAARRVLDPPEGGVHPDVALLTRFFGLDEILGWLGQAHPYDTFPIARTRDVMGFVAAHLAEILERHDLAEAWGVEDPADQDAVRAALEKSTNKAGEWAVDAVSRWIAHGRSEPAPFELAGWLKGLNTRSKARKAVEQDLMDARLDLGPAVLSLYQIVDTMRYPYDDRSHVELADRLQDARERLRKSVVAQALTAAAQAGELDHSSLTAAAIALCRTPPPRLRNRYAALLVDEVQDANPEQLELYLALSQLPADPPIRTVMVGDVRQSIYLFRGAEPAGFAELARTADDRDGRVDLNTNFRSHRALVDAHRALFAALDAPMRSAGFVPIDSLDRLTHHEANDGLALDPGIHDPPSPVWMVVPDGEGDPGYREMDERAVHAFWTRVRTAWTESGHERDTAVILTPSWALARRVCSWIRAWSGRDDSAFVDGGGAWLVGTVGTDLRMLLRALLDPTDDIAWMATWKHPMIGLSDAALARIRAGVGMVSVPELGDPVPAPGRCQQLGWTLDADALVAPHSPEDIAAFARVRDALREARSGVGRTDLAGLFDRLAHRLEWRVILTAGPGGDDDVAALEVALDLIRELEAENAPPDAVLAAFEDADATELPRVHIDRPDQSISCTTTFQAKGLAWDHVCVVSPGRSGRRYDPEPPVTAWLQLDGIPHRIVGLKFDPSGALSPFKDPVGRLGSRIAAFRHEEECARLAYVAVTRARRSVTMGLPRDTRRCSELQRLCAVAWSTPELAGEAIAHVPWPEPPPAARAPTGWVSASLAPPPRPPEPRGRTWQVRQPSSYASHHSIEERRNDAERYAGRVRLNAGLTVGGPPIDPPERDRIRPWEWGEIAHGWIANWGFSGDPHPEDAASWLQSAWALSDRDVVDWLVALSRRLPEVGGPLWERVSDPKAKLWFEHPFVGIAGRRDDVILSGRMDLIVQRGKNLTVIDFKAGGRSPTGWDDLVEQGGLKTYGPQLDAYRTALVTAGRKVDAVGLWFVRTGTQVLW